MNTPGDTARPPHAPEPRADELGRITREYVLATAERADRADLEPLRALLRRVREFLQMDIAFVAEFMDGRRVFRHVDAGAAGPGPLAPGGSDALEDTYCQRAVDGRFPLAIPDASALAEARDLPVTQALGIGSYLSAPIVLPDGQVYGTLCCFSHQPKHHLGDAEVGALRAVARLVSDAVSQGGPSPAPL